MELIFTEDSYYRLAGYESVLQDVADMIYFPLRCVVKAVCGQTTKTVFSCVMPPVSWAVLQRAPAALALALGVPWFLLAADLLQ